MKQNIGELPAPLVRPNFATVYAVGLSFLRHSLRWLGVVEHDLDDVLQDVMLAAYRRLGSFDPARPGRRTGGVTRQNDTRVSPAETAPSEPLKRWLFGIAWRQVGHYRERAHRRREVAVGAGVAWPFQP